MITSLFSRTHSSLIVPDTAGMPPRRRARDSDASVTLQAEASKRRKISETCSDEPDVVLLCDDGVEILAHKSRLAANCELFDEMFRLARSDTPGTVAQASSSSSSSAPVLPVIPLLESSAIALLVLPMAYRASPATLQDRSFDELLQCVKFAHRIGMSTVEWIAQYLEPHIPRHVSVIYALACNLDLQRLRSAAFPEMLRCHALSEGPDITTELGLTHAKEVHLGKLNLFKEFLCQLDNIKSSSEDAWDLACGCHYSDVDRRDLTLNVGRIYRGLCKVILGVWSYENGLEEELDIMKDALEESNHMCSDWREVEQNLEKLRNLKDRLYAS